MSKKDIDIALVKKLDELADIESELLKTWKECPYIDTSKDQCARDIQLFCEWLAEKGWKTQKMFIDNFENSLRDLCGNKPGDLEEINVGGIRQAMRQP